MAAPVALAARDVATLRLRLLAAPNHSLAMVIPPRGINAGLRNKACVDAFRLIV
jgi:hypothetical protein